MNKSVLALGLFVTIPECPFIIEMTSDPPYWLFMYIRERKQLYSKLNIFSKRGKLQLTEQTV